MSDNQIVTPVRTPQPIESLTDKSQRVVSLLPLERAAQYDSDVVMGEILRNLVELYNAGHLRSFCAVYEHTDVAQEGELGCHFHSYTGYDSKYTLSGILSKLIHTINYY